MKFSDASLAQQVIQAVLRYLNTVPFDCKFVAQIKPVAFDLLGRMLPLALEVSRDQMRLWMDFLSRYNGYQIEHRMAKRADRFSNYPAQATMAAFHGINVKMAAKLKDDDRIDVINYGFRLIEPIMNLNELSIHLLLLDMIYLLVPPVIEHPDFPIPDHLLQSLTNVLLILAEMKGEGWGRDCSQISWFTSRPHDAYCLYPVLGLIKVCLLRRAKLKHLVGLSKHADRGWLVRMAQVILTEPLLSKSRNQACYIKEKLCMILPVLRVLNTVELRKQVVLPLPEEREIYEHEMAKICSISQLSSNLSIKMNSDAYPVNPHYSGLNDSEREIAKKSGICGTDNPLYLTPLAQAELESILPKLDLSYLEGLVQNAAAKLEANKLTVGLERLLVIAAHLGVKISKKDSFSSELPSVMELHDKLQKVTNPTTGESNDMKASLKSNEELQEKPKKEESAMAAIKSKHTEFTEKSKEDIHRAEKEGAQEDQPICIACKNRLDPTKSDHGFMVVTGIQVIGRDLCYDGTRRIREGGSRYRIDSCFHQIHLTCANRLRNECRLCTANFNAIACPSNRTLQTGGLPRHELTAGDYMLINTLEDYLDYVPRDSSDFLKMMELLETFPKLLRSSPSCKWIESDLEKKSIGYPMARGPALLLCQEPGNLGPWHAQYSSHLYFYPAQYRKAAAAKWICFAGMILALRKSPYLKCDWNTWLKMSAEEQRVMFNLPLWSELSFDEDPEVRQGVAMPTPIREAMKPLPNSFDKLYLRCWRSGCKRNHESRLSLCLRCHATICNSCHSSITRHKCGGDFKLYMGLQDTRLFIGWRYEGGISLYSDRFGDYTLSGNDLRLNKQVFDHYSHLWYAYDWVRYSDNSK